VIQAVGQYFYRYHDGHRNRGSRSQDLRERGEEIYSQQYPECLNGLNCTQILKKNLAHQTFEDVGGFHSIRSVKHLEVSVRNNGSHPQQIRTARDPISKLNERVNAGFQQSRPREFSAFVAHEPSNKRRLFN